MLETISKQTGTLADLDIWLKELRQTEADSLDADTHGGCLFWFGICLLFIPLMGVLSLMQTVEGKNIGGIVGLSTLCLVVAIPSMLRGRKSLSHAAQNRFHPGRLHFIEAFLELLKPQLANSTVSLEGDLRQMPRTDLELLRDFAKPVVVSNGLSCITRTWLQMTVELEDGLNCDISVRTKNRFRVVRKPGFRGADGKHVPSYTCIDDVCDQTMVSLNLTSSGELDLSQEDVFRDWTLESTKTESGSFKLDFTLPEGQRNFHKALENPGLRDAYLKVEPNLTPEILMECLAWVRK